MTFAVGQNLWLTESYLGKKPKIQNLSTLFYLDKLEGREGRGLLKVCWNSLPTASWSFKIIG